MEIVKQAFAAKREQSQGNSILLFDELYHSGATVSAIAELLKRGQGQGGSPAHARAFQLGKT
jgi:predicted amidophosphoribosyltransferase